MAAQRLAKLSAPRASDAIVRERLHRMLDLAAQRGAVWVAAEPGAGKSTLGATWAATRSGTLVWYRIDAGDADPVVAFRYLSELLRTGGRKRTRLPSYRPQRTERLDAAARAFFRAFYAAIPMDSTLVFDDAHLASETDLDVLLQAAMREAPPGVSVLILSRQDPAGILLEELARGALRVVDGAQLGFTGEEATTLLSLQISAERALQLQRQTGGWAAGLMLLASSSPAPAAGGTAGAQPTIDAFLAQHVLRSLSGRELLLLGAASLLPDVDAAALRAMGCGTDASATLERLCRQHAFVMRLDRKPPSWRLHDLLRDAVAQRFETLADVGERQRILSAAAELAAQRDLIAIAVNLLLRAQQADAALALAAHAAPTLLRQQRLLELDQAVGELDAARVERSPALQKAIGTASVLRGQPLRAIAHFERAFTLTERSERAEALVVAASAVNAILESWSDYSDAETWRVRLQRCLPAREQLTDPSDGLLVDAVTLRAEQMLRFGDARTDEAAQRRLLDALAQSHAGVDPVEAVFASTVLIESAGYYAMDEGLFRRAVEQTAPWLKRPDLPSTVLAGWLVAIGPLWMRWPLSGVSLPAADPIKGLELAASLAREHGAQTIAFSALLQLCHLRMARHELALVGPLLGELRELMDPLQPAQLVNTLSAEARWQALSDQPMAALERATRALELADQHAFPPSERWTLELGLAQGLIGAGRVSEARDFLAQKLDTYPVGGRREMAQLLADFALIAEDFRQKRVPADAAIVSLIRGARELSWHGFANQLPKSVAQVCARALGLKADVDFVREVIDRRRLQSPDPDTPSWPWPLRIEALKGLRVALNERAIDFGARPQKKPLDLLKLLIARGPDPVDSAAIVDALWPEAEGRAPRASFDMAMMRLRKLLCMDEAVRVDGGRVALNRQLVWVDAWAYASGALETYAGPLFGSDSAEAWWIGAREKLHQLHLRRTVQRGAQLESEQRAREALELYEAALAQDSLAEEIYRAAIRCHLALNEPAGALRVYRRCREQLSLVLGVDPAPATKALVAALSR